MARLFITPRELDLFNDISREVMRDIAGQRVYLYSLSRARSMPHDVYNETPDKAFAKPIEMPARVQWNVSDLETGKFGHDVIRRLTVWVHTRDLLERQIRITTGDFISYGSSFYEVTALQGADTVYGQIEYEMGVKLECTLAREGVFEEKVIGPTWEGNSDPDAVQKTFHQTRGLSTNPEGPTGDVRDLQRKGVLDEPLDGTMEVSERGSDIADDSSFYDE